MARSYDQNMIKISSHLVWFCSLLSFRVVAFGSICREPSSNLDADTVRLNLHMCTGWTVRRLDHWQS